jgi:hypothetical protein
MPRPPGRDSPRRARTPPADQQPADLTTLTLVMTGPRAASTFAAGQAPSAVSNSRASSSTVFANAVIASSAPVSPHAATDGTPSPLIIQANSRRDT